MSRHHDDRQRPYEQGPSQAQDPRHRYALSLLSFSVAVLVLVQGVQPQVQPVHQEPSAVILDQLSLTVPNATFVEEATWVLEEAGYIVDYVPGEEVTVDLYRDLPRLGYDVVILRAHSAATNTDGDLSHLGIFTGESYNEHDYLDDRDLVRVRPARDEADNRYFSVSPRLFEHAKGEFDDGTLIVMMGCQGLTTPSMAQTLIAKGADAYVGWTTWVTADRTDTATLAFLEMHLVGGESLVDAVQGTNLLVGEDEEYGSRLLAVGEPEAMVNEPIITLWTSLSHATRW